MKTSLVLKSNLGGLSIFILKKFKITSKPFVVYKAVPLFKLEYTIIIVDVLTDMAEEVYALKSSFVPRKYVQLG